MNCLGIARKISIVSGYGESNVSKLNAFDNALIDANIHDLNLIKVSSILAKDTSIEEKFEIEKGSFAPCVLSISYGTENELICSGIGVGFNNQNYGYVMESQGTNNQEVSDKLNEKLTEMAKNRSQEIINKKIITKEQKVNKTYGCVITAVIYLF